MSKQIQIRIYPDGKIKAETKGIKGKGCTGYIKLIENLLDAKAVDSGYTAEYYEQSSATGEQVSQSSGTQIIEAR